MSIWGATRLPSVHGPDVGLQRVARTSDGGI